MRNLRRNRLLLLIALSAIASSAAATNLVYYGGPVVGNAKVVMVNWGTNVPAGIQAIMPLFYGDLVQSDYWTILREYATNILAHDGSAGSNQQIDFGSFIGAITITPVKCSGSASCTVTDIEVGTELGAQITAGILPAPTTDGAGHVNTVYMVHFGSNVTISQNGSQSCQVFCATFTNFSNGGMNIPAGIIPDQTTGACTAGCGGGATGLNAETDVSAYMLANIATDPLLPSAATFAKPVAWYDSNFSNGGDIADKCNAGSDAVQITVNGNSYTVAKLWSNQLAACVSTSSFRVVKPSAGTHGGISPDLLQAVISGNSTAFTITPDAGFTATVSGSCGGALAGTTYTTNPITVDCTVIATFIDRIFGNGFETP